MKRVSLYLPALAAALLASSSFAQARPLFVPSPLSTFDGTRWSGLVIGQTTFKEIRPRFETGNGAYERSTELTQAKNSGVRIDCLWTKQGNDEILSAITLRYRTVTPTGQQLERAFDPEAKEGQPLYLRGRFEDWRVLRFPGRGVAAFQVRSGENYSTPLLVLGAPTSMDRLSQPLLNEETEVEERLDPMANEPKIGEFGDITVDFDGKEAEAIPSRVRSDVREDVRDAYAGGTLRWNRSAPGHYNLRVSGSRAKDGASGSFSVSTEIEAQGPYGLIKVSGYGSQRWKRDDDDYPRNPASAFERALREARRDGESKFEKAMIASGPPPVEAIREDQWRELVTMLRSDEVVAPDDAPNTTDDAPVVGF